MEELLRKRENESENEYIARLYRDKIELELTNKDIHELVNKELGCNYAESTIRGIGKYINEGIQIGFEKALSESKNENDIIKELNEKKRELQEERYKLQAEKVENNRWLREKARVDLRFEKLEQSIKQLEPLLAPKNIELDNTYKNKEAILTLSDQHFGKEFLIKGLKGEIINEYNESIFQQRMWKLLNKTVEIIEKEDLLNVRILMLGDIIDGILRMTSLQKLQYGIVDSTMRFAEFMANWLNKLSNYVDIDLYSTLGNHSQIRPLGSGNGDFPEENMERIVMWYLETRLKDNYKIKIHKNETGFIFFNVLGVNIMASHGEETNLEQAIKDYCTMYNEKIDYFFCGHLHSNFKKTIGIGQYSDIEVIRVPSLVGVDDFSMKIRRTGKAGSLLAVIEENEGKTIEYGITLN